jgi:hypothetical protein
MTMTKTLLTLLIVFAAAVSTQGCSVSSYDRRDAAWDPKPGQTLIDQIPNWGGESQSRCCGHLRQCQANQTARC